MDEEHKLLLRTISAKLDRINALLVGVWLGVIGTWFGMIILVGTSLYLISK